MIRLEICAAVHGDQIGEGGTPDILAGLGAAVGDGKVARPSRGTLIAEHLGQDAVHKGGETGVVGIVTGAPVAVEDGVCQVALPPCGVGGEPGSVGGCGVVAAVENIAVGRNGLRLKGLVRPAERHFRCHRADEIIPPRHLMDLPGALVLDEEDLGVSGERGGLWRACVRAGQAPARCGQRRGGRDFR